MPSDPIWTYHPAFGIVHPSGCNVCLSYMRHVAVATQLDAQDTSLRVAIKDRDGQISFQYLNGVSEGIRLRTQDLDDSTADLLAKYRAERDEVLEMMKLRTAQLVAAEEELYQLKEQFKELQALLDDTAIIATSASLSACVETSTYHTLNVQNAETSREDQIKPIHTRSLPTPPPTPSSTTKSASLSSWSSGQDRTSYEAATHSNAGLSNVLHFPPVFNSEPSEPAWESMGVYSLQELAVLLRKARAGDEQAFMTVDTIYTTAQSIPELDRTPYQQFVVLEWEPQSFPSTCASSPTLTVGNQCQTNDVESSVPEIFVDSSRWGIGFILNGQWLAWKLMPGWETDGRDNNWAELVAVELGLLVIASAGFQPQTVIVRSDNTGVVAALRKGSSKHPRQPEVLRRIKAITQSHRFDLDIRWISSGRNPADQPSRGHLPPHALRFPSTIDLPHQLLPFLSNLT
ncbi:hypothetical protein H2248_012569 [Termitomyces sp. 'cryptogamus']|nr:hypothetical protein H2248_012569 [Termitomyces sp. 'cryptogamus']